jgi:2-aminobenzoate-CoA ligase
MSLSWAFGLGALLTFPLRAGAAVALVDAGQPLLAAVASARATVLFGVPTLYRMLLRQPHVPASDLQSIRCCVSAAEPLPADVGEEWRDRTGFEILDGLGTTELTHIFISARRGFVRPGLMGTTVAGYDARIVDLEGRELLDGTPGLLAVRGPTGALYWRDPEMQQRHVQNGWTLTGDICIRHADGWFEHVRRSDDLILSAGYKVSMHEVEQTLNEHLDVERAHVFSVPDAMRGAIVNARVVPADGAELNGMAERLQHYLKEEIASFKCPRRIEVV